MHLVSEPYRSGTPTYMLKSKIRNKTYCHVPRSFGPYLPAWEGFDAATCSAATDPASLLGRAPALPRAPRPQTRLLAREGSDAATWPMALDLASILGRPPTLPRAPWLRTLLPYSGGLRRCPVPRGSGPCFPTREGSGAATCPAAPDPASLLGSAPILPRALRLSTGHEPQE
jgi:hypothetical protein